jgi:hypothetical protein
MPPPTRRAGAGCQRFSAGGESGSAITTAINERLTSCPDVVGRGGELGWGLVPAVGSPGSGPIGPASRRP